jgi:single-stranded DNA-binding protein
MSFTMIADGRLAHEPHLSFGTGQPWTEFRLLSNRMSRRDEVVEAVTFVAFGALAEDFCQRVEKGQLIKAIGTQMTDRYADRTGVERISVRFRLVHFEAGPRPRARQEAQDGTARRRPPERPAQAQHREPSAGSSLAHGAPAMEDSQGGDPGIF